MTHDQQTGFRSAGMAADGRPPRRRVRHPAAASRVLAAGISASAAIGLGGLMFHEARVADRSQDPMGTPLPQVDSPTPPLQLDPRVQPTVAVPKPVVAPPPSPEAPPVTETRASR